MSCLLGLSWPPQLSREALCMRDRGDRMFEDQLLSRARFQEYRELVETLDFPKQFRAIKQVERYRGLLTPNRV